MRKKKITPILQEEKSECGLACLAMITTFNGYSLSLRNLRNTYPGAERGMSIRDMMQLARELNFFPRALRVNEKGLRRISLPCLLHWNMDHFVVLEAIKNDRFVVVDPAIGRYKLTYPEMQRHFFGIAMELTPQPNFLERPTNRSDEPSNLSSIVDTRSYIKPTFQLIIISVVALIFSLVSPLAIQIIVDKVISKQDLDLLLVVSLVFLGSIILGAFADYVRTMHITRMSAYFRVYITSSFLNKFIWKDWSYFNRRTLGGMVAQYNSLNFIVSFIVTTFATLFSDSLFVLVLIVILFVMDAKLAFIVVVISVLVILTRFGFTRVFRRLQDRQIASRATEEAHFVESVRNIISVKSNSIEGVRFSDGISSTVASANADFNLATTNAKFNLFMKSLIGAETVLILYLLAISVMAGQMTIGLMYAFYTYRQILNERMSSLVDGFGEVLNLRVHIDRIIDVFHAEDNNQVSSIARHMLFAGDINFCNVSFSIDGGKKQVLDHFNARCGVGEFVHISGPSGVGKTTLLKIFLGVIAPNSGTIRVDNVIINETHRATLQNSVGVVLQEDSLFKGNIIDNIALFDEYVDILWVEECCKICEVFDEIQELPMGLQTQIGDLGANISTGQQQRILLARALYRRPTILVLDEATANLNIDIERKILVNLKALNKTILFSAHSEIVGEYADKIWELGK